MITEVRKDGCGVSDGTGVFASPKNEKEAGGSFQETNKLMELLRVAEGYNALQLQAVCRHHIRNAPHLQEGNSANPSDG